MLKYWLRRLVTDDSVAQVVEQLTFNQWVESSSLFRVTNADVVQW